MRRRNSKNRFKRAAVFLSVFMTIALLFTGCDSGGGKKVKLDPKNPVIISVWHYYNGAIMNAFEAMIKDFNETVGAKEGIIVEGYGHGNVSELEKAVISAAKGEVGSMEIPDIFAPYADTAYEAEKMSILANLDDYFSKKDQEAYIDSYIEEGKIGQGGELRIFPIAKSTEVFMINETDWQVFADANGLSFTDLSTIEGIVRVSKLYYDWTDAMTPDAPNDGKAFFGRDVMANLFIGASKEFDTEIFRVENGSAVINVNEDVMRKIWDNYYVPYISGYYTAYGKFRSDDAKVGDIVAYIGSTSSAAYFPKEVTVGGDVHAVQAKVLAVPHFEGAKKVMIQQGAGMVVTKSTPKEEYASIVFLKWFTDSQKNIEFAALSGYMPVKKEANDYNTFISKLTESGQTLGEITNETLSVAFEEMKTSEMYTNKAFDGGAAARSVLEHNLQDKAAAGREKAVLLMEAGSSHEQAVAELNTEENFRAWLEDFTSKLNEAAG